MAELTLAQALGAIEGAQAKAAEMGLAMAIYVVDDAANVKAFQRMDGALLGATDIALRKARTAALFKMESGDLPPLAQPGGGNYGIEETNGGLVLLYGGVPLKTAAGDVVGAIGTSGSTQEDDLAVAKAGAAAFH